MLLEKICKELGVEVGEKWKNDVGDTYKLTKDGLFYEYLPGEWEEVGSPDYMRLLKGELKPNKEEERYILHVWRGDKNNEYCCENNLIFKTKKDAIEAANKMVNALKIEKYEV